MPQRDFAKTIVYPVHFYVEVFMNFSLQPAGCLKCINLEFELIATLSSGDRQNFHP